MAETHRVFFYEPVLHNVLHEESGMVGRYLHKRASMIKFAAKRQAGKKTGRLRASIEMKHFISPTGQYYTIGSKVPYALMHHEGTRPHVILPKKTGGKLVFKTGRKLVITNRVNHPGTRPNRYLSDWLFIALLP